MDASGPPSLPGIQESQAESKTTAGAAKLASKQMTLDVTKSTPRIDISRASSSSQHEDSRDSSPENVFDQVHKLRDVLSQQKLPNYHPRV